MIYYKVEPCSIYLIFFKIFLDKLHEFDVDVNKEHNASFLDITLCRIYWNIILQVCIGKRKCSIFQSNQFFDGDPCPGIPKALLVEAKCT